MCLSQIGYYLYNPHWCFFFFLQHPSFKSSDTENFSVNVDVDDEDDMSTDDDDDVSVS